MRRLPNRPNLGMSIRLRDALASMSHKIVNRIASETLIDVEKRYPGLSDKRKAHEVVRRQITAMVEDVILEAKARLSDVKPQSASDVRNCGATLVTFSSEMAEKELKIKKFLFERMYHEPGVMKVRDGVNIIIRNLFHAYMDNLDELPERWELEESPGDKPATEQKKARLVADFIAGMTDRFAVREHQRLFDETPELG